MELLERVVELSLEGYCCSQVMALLLLELLGEEDDGFVRAMGGLINGGGFSGGAIMGAGLMIYVTAFGFKDIRRFFKYNTYQRVVLCSLLTYAASKCYSFYTGANDIHSIIPLGTPGAILSSGLILVLNICVGLIVTCTMYAFYAVFRKGEV